MQPPIGTHAGRVWSIGWRPPEGAIRVLGHASHRSGRPSRGTDVTVRCGGDAGAVRLLLCATVWSRFRRPAARNERHQNCRIGAGTSDNPECVQTSAEVRGFCRAWRFVPGRRPDGAPQRCRSGGDGVPGPRQPAGRQQVRLHQHAGADARRRTTPPGTTPPGTPPTTAPDPTPTCGCMHHHPTPPPTTPAPSPTCTCMQSPTPSPTAPAPSPSATTPAAVVPSATQFFPAQP